jgi:hypothetical protein
VSVRAVSRRSAGVAVAVALGLGVAGCGDDEGRVSQETVGTETSPSTGTTPTAPAETAPTETETAPETESSPDAGAGLPDGHDAGRRRPEDRPGGAGDEVPASSQALFTGRAGRITPRTVRVPAYIAVRVELRSGDGARYVLRGGGRKLRASRRPARPVTFDGLRTGKRLVLQGTGGRVVIEASAEPGP